MKTPILVLLCILTLGREAMAGNRNPDRRQPRKTVRNFIWFHPNRVRVINGLAMGPFNFQSFRHDSSLTVNGLNLEMPGVAIFPFPVRGSYMTVNGLDLSPFRYSGTTNGVSLSFSSSGWASRGLHVAVYGYVDSLMSGLQAGVLMTRSGLLRGLQVSPFCFNGTGKGVMLGVMTCRTDTLEGISIAGINIAEKLQGLQLGAINYTTELRGMQFGFINVAINCRRKVMPLMQISKRARAAH